MESLARMYKDFPKIIYVTQDGDKGEKYFLVWTDELASEKNGDKVGVYELIDKGTVKVTTEFVH